MVRTLITGLVAVAIVAIALFASSGQPSTAQDEPTVLAEETVQATVAPEPTATPTAYPFRSLTFNLLARADLTVDTSGPVTVSAATVSVLAGAKTVEFTTEGPTVITVQTGAVTITADQASAGVADIVSVIGLEVPVASPEAADAIVVTLGVQVYLPAGSTASLRNDTEAAATVVILSVVPSGATTP